MNHLKTAQEIITLVGGLENITHIEHCSTRLRLSLQNNQRVQIAELEKLPGVLGVRLNVQCQVIIGHEVVKVYEAARKLLDGIDHPPQTEPTAPRPQLTARVVDFVISIFQPLIPAIAGGGVLKSLLLLLDLMGWLTRDSATYNVLDNIGSAPLYFLPILVAITTAMKLKVNVLVAVSAVSTLLLPAMTQQLASGAVFFSLVLPNIAYASQVFPAILCVLFYAQAETLFNRYSPGAVRIFLSPMLSLLVTVPVTLLILGPLGYQLGSGLATVIFALYGKMGFVATALLAAVLPFMVASGMHKPMIPYAVSSMSQFGREMLYLPASLAHNIAESGACFAIALRTRDKTLRSTAISAGISALFGITEPALYGVTLLNKPALYSVIIGSVLGGAFLGWMMIEAFALVGPGLASISMFIAPDNNHNILYALVGAAIAFSAAFISALLLWRDRVTPARQPAGSSIALCSPAQGQAIPLSQVNDEVFATGVLGSGIAIIPDHGELYAPANGTVINVFASGHAISLRTDRGVELVFHIGIDTIKLEGRYFHPQVVAGQQVHCGETLITFDLPAIIGAGYDPVIVAVVTNSDRFHVSPCPPSGRANPRQQIMSLQEHV